MSTSASINAVNILTAPMPSAGKPQAAPDAPEVPFNQVLQREVSARPEKEQAAKMPPKEKDASAAAQASGQAAAQPQKTESSKSVSKKESETGKEEAEAEGDELETAAAASAELLALVASLAQQAKSAPADGTDAAAAGEAGTSDAGPSGISEARDKLAAGLLAADKLSGKSDEAGIADPKAKPDTAKNFAGFAGNAGQGQSADKQALTSATGAEPGKAGMHALQAALEQKPTAQEQTAATATSPLASLQQAMNKIQPPAAAEKLTPHVGTPAWDQAVGQKVVWMVAGGQQSASLTLNPPDLGPLQVVLNVNNSQATATFVAAQPEVRQALEAALPKLREMLGDAGIQLGQANISAGQSHQGGFADQRGQRQGSGGRFGQEDTQAAQPVQGVRQQAIKGGSGMVDTFA